MDALNEGGEVAPAVKRQHGLWWFRAPGEAWEACRGGFAEASEKAERWWANCRYDVLGLNMDEEVARV